MWPFSKKSPYRDPAEPSREPIYCVGCKHLEPEGFERPAYCRAVVLGHSDDVVRGRSYRYEKARKVNRNYDCTKREAATDGRGKGE